MSAIIHLVLALLALLGLDLAGDAKADPSPLSIERVYSEEDPAQLCVETATPSFGATTATGMCQCFVSWNKAQAQAMNVRLSVEREFAAQVNRDFQWPVLLSYLGRQTWPRDSSILLTEIHQRLETRMDAIDAPTGIWAAIISETNRLKAGETGDRLSLCLSGQLEPQDMARFSRALGIPEKVARDKYTLASPLVVQRVFEGDDPVALCVETGVPILETDFARSKCSCMFEIASRAVESMANSSEWDGYKLHPLFRDFVWPSFIYGLAEPTWPNDAQAVITEALSRLEAAMGSQKTALAFINELDDESEYIRTSGALVGHSACPLL